MSTITITTYKELADFVTAFGDDHVNMLVICSRGGLGKSEAARRTLNTEDIVYIGGHVTPLKLYELLYNGRDKPVVFDEIDELIANPSHIALLKQLCETRKVKRIMWSSTDPRAAEIDGGAGYFHTQSHVLMLCNAFDVFIANAVALRTRAMLVRFMPTSHEILAKLQTYATDDEIVLFLKEFHGAIEDFNLRTYVQLEDLKNAGLNWKRYAFNETNIPYKVKEIANLLTRFDNDLNRIQHYSSSRRDYYNWKPDAAAYLQRRTIASRLTA